MRSTLITFACRRTFAPQRCRQTPHSSSHRSFWIAWMRSTGSILLMSPTVTCEVRAGDQLRALQHWSFRQLAVEVACRHRRGPHEVRHPPRGSTACRRRAPRGRRWWSASERRPPRGTGSTAAAACPLPSARRPGTATCPPHLQHQNAVTQCVSDSFCVCAGCQYLRHCVLRPLPHLLTPFNSLAFGA